MTKGSTRHDESCGVGFLFLSFFFLISFSTDALPLAASTECISISRPPSSRKYRYFNESVCYYSRLASTSSRRSVYSKIHRRETSGVASNGAPLSEATIFLKIPYPKGVWNSLNPRYSPGEGVSLSLCLPPTSFSTLSLLYTRPLVSRARFHALTMFPSSNLCLFPRPSGGLRSRPLRIYRSPRELWMLDSIPSSLVDR